MPPLEVAYPISLIVTYRDNKPCLELRKVIFDMETIKKLVSAAFHKVPIIIQPTFLNELNSINSLMDKGIIYRDRETGELRFTF